MSIQIFIAITAIFNGVMDTLLWHFYTSVFRDLNPRWWNPSISWQYQKNFLGIVRLDAWHLAKYGMLLGIIGAAEFGTRTLGWWDVPLAFVSWFIGFELTFRALRKGR